MQAKEEVRFEVKRLAREAAEAIGFPELAEEIEANLRRMMCLGIVRRPSRCATAAAAFVALKKRYGRTSVQNIARLLGLLCNGGGVQTHIKKLARELEKALSSYGEPTPAAPAEPREKEDLAIEVEVLTNEDKERIVLETLLEEGPLRNLNAIVAAVKKHGYDLGEHSVQRAVKRLLEKGLIARTNEGYVPMTLDLDEIERTAVRHAAEEVNA